jgi:hypothetical protein
MTTTADPARPTASLRPRTVSSPGRPARRGPQRLLVAIARPPYRWLRHVSGTLGFDRRYGVHTEEHVEVDQLGVSSADAVGYIPCNYHLLPLVLPRREVGTDDVLLDAGSGMGRIVLQAAARYPWRRVVGVELSTRLHGLAERNLAHNRHRLRCSDVVLRHGDVLDLTDAELDEVTVVFCYNPFGGATFATFVQRLLASVDRRPRRLRLVYVNPREEAALLRTGRVQRVRSRRLGRWLARVYDVTV